MRLSNLGRVQGSLAQLASAGQAAATPQASATNNDVRRDVQNVVNAYNEVNRAATSAGRSEGRRPAATAADSEDFRRVGIGASPNGTLNLDARTLERALQSDANGVRESVARIGRQAERTAGEALASADNGGRPSAPLEPRLRGPESAPQDQQGRTTAAQQAAPSQSEAARFSVAGGLASYQRIFSL